MKNNKPYGEMIYRKHNILDLVFLIIYLYLTQKSANSSKLV